MLLVRVATWVVTYRVSCLAGRVDDECALVGVDCLGVEL